MKKAFENISNVRYLHKAMWKFADCVGNGKIFILSE